MPDGDIIDQLAAGFGEKPREDQAEERIRSSAEAGSLLGRSQDTEGRLADLSSRTGLSTDILREATAVQLDELDHKRRRREVLRERREVAEFLASSPTRAFVSRDDYERMARLATITDRLKLFQNPERSGAELGTTGQAIARGLGGIGTAFYGLLQWNAELQQGVRRVLGLSGDEPDAAVQFFQERVDVARALPEAIVADRLPALDFDLAGREVARTDLEAPSAFGISVIDVGSAAVQLAPSLVAAPLGLGGVTVAAGAQSAGGTFAEKRAKGADLGEASGLALVSGGITAAVTRLFPGGVEAVTKRIAASANPREALKASIAAAVGKGTLDEMGEEFIDETLQALLVDGQSFDQALRRGLKAGAIGGLLGGGVGGAVQFDINRAAARNRAIDQAEVMNEAKPVFDDMKTAQRSPELAAEYFRTLNQSQGFVDPDVIVELAQDPEAASRLVDAGLDPKEAARTADSGGMMQIDDVADLYKSLQPDEFTAVVENFRATPMSPSAAEAKAADRKTEADIALSEDLRSREERDELRQEVTRLEKEFAGAANVPRGTDAKATISLLARASVLFHQRHGGRFSSPASLLRRIVIEGAVDPSDVPRGTVFNQTAEDFIADQPANIRTQLEQIAQQEREAQAQNPNLPEPDEQAVLNQVRMMADILGGQTNQPGTAGREELGDTFETRRKFFTMEGAVDASGRSPAEVAAEVRRSRQQQVDGDAPTARIQRTLDQKPEDAPLGRVVITNQGYIVQLFSGANLSTVLHETGHIFLEEIRALVNSGEADPAMLKDWEQLRDWLGGADSQAITEEQHEQFARGFEAYLMEGSAPAPELESAFGRFRRWLTNIYQTVRGLRVELNDEVRGVFDRMLASDMEIRQMAELNELTEKAPEELEKLPGVGPARRESINQKLHDFRQRTADRLFTERAKVVARHRKQWRGEVRAEMATEPVYRAWEEIKQAGGLRAVRLEVDYGKDTVAALRKKGLVAKKSEDGAIPESVASRHGFEDGDALVVALLDADRPGVEMQNRVNSRAQLAEIEYPTMDAVIDSPEFQQLMDQRAAFLAKGTKAPNPIERKALRRQAEKVLADMPMRQATNEGRFFGAMMKELRAERRAILADDFAAASLHNLNARKQHELARLAKETRDTREKALRKAEKLRQVTPGKGRIDYTYYLHASKLAQAYGLTIGGPSVDHGFLQGTENLPLVLQQFAGDPDAPGPGGFLLDATEPWLSSGLDSPRLAQAQADAKALRNKAGVAPRPYQTLQVHEFEQLREFLAALESQGRELADQRIMDGKEKLEDFVERSVPLMSKKKGRLPFVSDYIDGIDRDSFIGKMADTVDSSLWAPLKRADPILQTLDGSNGPRFDKFDASLPMAQMQIARGQADTSKEKRFEEMQGLLSPHLDVLKQAITRLGKSPDPGVPVPERAVEAGVKQWTGDRLLAVVLNMGNEYNMAAMATGFNWLTSPSEAGDQDVDMVPLMRIAGMFTSQELDAVQGVWDAVNTLWADSAKVHTKQFGLPPKKVDADEITVETSDGEVKTLAGGYWPLRADRADKSSNYSRQQDAESMKDMFGATFAPASVRRSHLIARKDFGGKMIMLDPARVLNEHLDFTITFITHSGFVSDMRKIMSDTDWQAAARRKIGDNAYRQLGGWVRSIAGQDFEDLNFLDKLAQKAKGATSMWLLAGKLRGVVTTADAVFALMGNIGAANYAKGVGMLQSRGAINRWKFMLKHSTFMRDRLRGGWDREARDLIGGTFDVRSVSQYQRKKTTAQKWLLAPYAIPSLAYEWPAWQYVYETQFQKTGDVRTAIQAADLAIKQSSPSGAQSDLSTFMRSRKAGKQMMTMFSSWAHARLNHTALASRAWWEGDLSHTEYLSLMFFQNILAPAFFGGFGYLLFALRGDLSDEEDREALYKNVGKSLLVDNVRGIPMAGEITESMFDAVVEEKGLRRSLQQNLAPTAVRVTAGVIGDGVGGMYSAIVADSDAERQEAIWDIAHLVSWSSGIPASKIAEDFLKGLEQADETGNPLRVAFPGREVRP